MQYRRRSFFMHSLAYPLALNGLLKLSPDFLMRSHQNLKISLNAYSFHDALTSGQMNIQDLLSWCSEQGFAAVDITAYYFPGYPLVPSNDVLYAVKKSAFRLGLEISGTGVRNDFTWADADKRAADIRLVKDWILAAERLGVPVLRIFAGNQVNPLYTWDEVAQWVIAAIEECIDFGRQHGVIIGLQNHHDFIKTADQVKIIMDRINSAWFGLILDTGSFRQNPDPYLEIEKTIAYAVNWQIKEKIFVNGLEVETDISRLFKIIKTSDYQGYLPIETLGPGDAKIKILKLLAQVKAQIPGD